MNAILKPLVLFDGLCPLCQGSVAWLKRLDWFKAVDFKETLFISHWEKIQSIKIDFSNEREDKIQPSNRQFSYSFPA